MAYISVEVDVDITEFSNLDIIHEAIKILKRIPNYYKMVSDELDFKIDSKALEVKSIRDEQYIEVFEKLKEKFTVSELEQLLTTK